MNKTRTIQYRTKSGNKILTKKIPFFDDPAASHKQDGDTYHQVLPTANGWRLFVHISEDGKTGVEEFWQKDECPEKITRDGVELCRVDDDVFTIMNPMRTGSGLMQKVDKSFLEIVKAGHRRSPGSTLGDKL